MTFGLHLGKAFNILKQLACALFHLQELSIKLSYNEIVFIRFILNFILCYLCYVILVLLLSKFLRVRNKDR